MDTVPLGTRSELDPRDLSIGMVHLGAGGFHRAHQACYTEQAMATTGQAHWAISASTQRGPTIRDQLAPQDGLYTVAARDGAHTDYHVNACLREVLDGPTQTELVIARLADPTVTVATITVTEKGYHLNPATHRLDLHDPAIRGDTVSQHPRTIIGRLVTGIRRRRSTDAGPLAILSCDNLTGNGALLHQAVIDYCTLLPNSDDLIAWINEHVTFPSTMVDRIVPSTTEADRATVETALGLRDEAPVLTEPFTQWVIEDNFPAARPPWETAGAQLVSDVAPYELTKLRTLNACHSLLAYLGGLAGIDTIAEAIAVDDLAEATHQLAAREVRPTLPANGFIDHADYTARILQRFANPALGHTTTQVAADGSLKIGPRLLGTVADTLTLSIEPNLATLTIAAWLRHILSGHADTGKPLTIQEPAAPTILRATQGHTGAATVRPALAAAGIRHDLLETRRFTSLIEGWYCQLEQAGTLPAVRAAIDRS